jgi:adenine-specific DNA-methyltransferase
MADFAKGERLAQAGGALRLVQFVHFHRAAELFLGRTIKTNGLLSEALKAGVVNEGLCEWLAKRGPNQGPAWAARAYSALLMPSERRSRGQFFTPEPIARVMATWAIQSKANRVLDPGSGPGQLLAAAHARLRELGRAHPEAQLVGVELSPLAKTFAALALAPGTNSAPVVELADFLTEFVARAKSFDAVIANPPYSRHQSLAATYKEEIGALADGITGARVYRSAGIYVHFLLRSLDLLKGGGRLAFLTPREFFDARYGGPIKAHLLARARLRALVVFDPAATAAFEGVLTTSAITLLERGTPDRAAVRVVHVHSIPSAAQLIAALEPNAHRGERPWGWIENVAYEDVAAASRWSSLLPGRRPVRKDGEGLVRLRDLVSVKRGIATGANRFFVLSKSDADAHGLRNGSLRPAIARAHLANTERITKAKFARWSKDGERVWLLDIRHTKLTDQEKAYLALGRKADLDERTLCSMREPWYKMERREPPPILVTYMSKDAPRFVRNEAKLVPLNVFHGLYPRKLTNRQVTALLAHLNSEGFRRKLRRAGRTYGAGLIKIEPGELGNVTVPDVRLTPEATRR